MNGWLYIRTYLCTHVCSYSCKYVCMYVCMYVRVCVATSVITDMNMSAYHSKWCQINCLDRSHSGPDNMH